MSNANDVDVHSAQAVHTRFHDVEQAIAEECTAVGRNRDDVTLIVVTKFQPVSVNIALTEVGQWVFGESRHQDAVRKVREPALAHANWHFIGQLQSNKARQVAAYAAALHSVDRPSLVTALANRDREVALPCFVEINLTDDPRRGGVQPTELKRLVDLMLQTPGIKLVGVMGVPAIDEPAEYGFERLLEYRESVLGLAPSATQISAGMSHDWKIALRFGATHLRIGTAITGPRPSLP